MKLETFFEKFDQFADAPDAVAKMRELVLNLALQGRFLTGSGIKSSSAEWKRVRLDSIATIAMGNSPPGASYNERGEGVPLINGPVEFSPGPFGLTVRTKFTSAPTKFCKRGDLLICVRGSTTGRTNIASFDACIGRGVAAINAGENQAFVNLFLWQRRSMIFALGTGSTFPSISYDDIASLQIDLPPLAEQKRIVAKVEELMALCDRLEAQQQERETRHAALARASLARFADAPTPANLPILFHPSYSIDPADLRKSILTLAIQGKLVEPDPTEEPVDDLLAKMQTRRNQLIEAKKIRKPRELPQVAEDELPFFVPAGWRWSRWGQICDWITYGFTRPMSHVETGPPIVTAKNVQDGYMTFENAHRADATEFAGLNPKDLPRKGDILITKDGTIGRAAVVDTDEPFCINQSVAVLWLESCLFYRPFLLMVIRSPFAQGPIWEAAEGMAIKHLSITDFGKMILPLPPLAEQRRIVAKVEQLMALVDALEKQLAASRTTAAKLMAAVVAELTAPLPIQAPESSESEEPDEVAIDL